MIESGDYLAGLEITKALLDVTLIPRTKGSCDLFYELLNAPYIATHRMVATLPAVFHGIVPQVQT